MYLTLAFLFIMYQDHLILPPSCSITLSFALPHSLSFSLTSPTPPPLQERLQPLFCSSSPVSSSHCKVNLKVCKVALLCVLTSCGHGVFQPERGVGGGGKNKSKTVSRLPTGSGHRVYENQLSSFRRIALFQKQGALKKRQTPSEPT